MKWKLIIPSLVLVAQMACNKPDHPYVNEDASTFTEIGSVIVGKGATAEINTYDPETKKVFVVTNIGTLGQVAVLDLSVPATPVVKTYIDMSAYGGSVRSVSVSNGKLAVSVEGFVKTDPGKVVLFRTTDYSLI